MTHLDPDPLTVEGPEPPTMQSASLAGRTGRSSLDPGRPAVTARRLRPPEYSADPGERCPVTDPFWCSRDRYHTGAHVRRSEKGPGIIGWPNTTEPVVDPEPLPRAPRRRATAYVLLALSWIVALVLVGLAVWWVLR